MTTQVTQPKFRYYITDTFDGLITGTNDLAVAQQFAASADFFVIDALLGEMLCEDEAVMKVAEVENPNEHN